MQVTAGENWGSRDKKEVDGAKKSHRTRTRLPLDARREEDDEDLILIAIQNTFTHSSCMCARLRPSISSNQLPVNPLESASSVFLSPTPDTRRIEKRDPDSKQGKETLLSSPDSQPRRKNSNNQSKRVATSDS